MKQRSQKLEALMRLSTNYSKTLREEACHFMQSIGQWNQRCANRDTSVLKMLLRCRGKKNYQTSSIDTSARKESNREENNGMSTEQSRQKPQKGQWKDPTASQEQF